MFSFAQIECLSLCILHSAYTICQNLLKMMMIIDCKYRFWNEISRGYYPIEKEKLYPIFCFPNKNFPRNMLDSSWLDLSFGKFHAWIHLNCKTYLCRLASEVFNIQFCVLTTERGALCVEFNFPEYYISLSVSLSISREKKEKNKQM